MGLTWPPQDRLLSINTLELRDGFSQLSALGEWALHPEVFELDARMIHIQNSPPSTEFFNVKLYRFISRTKDPCVFMVDGLVRPWGLVLPDLCLSAVTASSPSALQHSGGKHSGDSDDHGLAFEPIQDNPLVFLTQKIIFSVAITSARRV